jgi:hypothetical protein
MVAVKRQKKQEVLEFEDDSDDNIAEDVIGTTVQREDSDASGDGWESDGGEIEVLTP